MKNEKQHRLLFIIPAVIIAIILIICIAVAVSSKSGEKGKKKDSRSVSVTENTQDIVAESETLELVIVTVVLTIPTVLASRQLLIWLNTPDDILVMADAYIKVIFAGIFCTMSYNVASGLLRSIGDSKTPLYFLIFSSVLNIVLDIFFIVSGYYDKRSLFHRKRNICWLRCSIGLCICLV